MISEKCLGYGQPFCSSVSPSTFHQPTSLQRHHARKDTGLVVGFEQESMQGALSICASQMLDTHLRQAAG